MNGQDLKHAINEIFKASESLREALDTLDLMDYRPEADEVRQLEAMQEKAEKIAQRLQTYQKRREA